MKRTYLLNGEECIPHTVMPWLRIAKFRQGWCVLTQHTAFKDLNKAWFILSMKYISFLVQLSILPITSTDTTTNSNSPSNLTCLCSLLLYFITRINKHTHYGMRQRWLSKQQSNSATYLLHRRIWCFDTALFKASNRANSKNKHSHEAPWPGFSQWCARVIFIESVSSQSYLNFFQVGVESQELLSNFESLVWKLESNEIFHFFYVFCLRRNGAQHAAKMAPDKIKNGARCCFCKFHCKLFISKFFTKAVPILLLLLISLISTSLAQPCCNKYTSMSFA